MDKRQVNVGRLLGLVLTIVSEAVLLGALWLAHENGSRTSDWLPLAAACVLQPLAIWGIIQGYRPVTLIALALVEVIAGIAWPVVTTHQGGPPPDVGTTPYAPFAFVGLILAGVLTAGAAATVWLGDKVRRPV